MLLSSSAAKSAFASLLLTALASAGILVPPAQAAHQDGRVVIFAQPQTRADAIWMAQAKGAFKDEGLQVTVRWWTSGADVLREFRNSAEGAQAGAHFVVLSELLAVDLWQATGSFAVIAALARDADGYIALARSGVQGAEDLKGKGVGVQLGSPSAWFLGEYLRAHAMSERDVVVKEMAAWAEWDPGREGIDAVFARASSGRRTPRPDGGEVHRLATGKGYMAGYHVLGARQSYLQDHPGVAERLLRAIDVGRQHADRSKVDVLEFARDMFSVVDLSTVDADYATTERLVGLDPVAIEQFERLGRWMAEAGLQTRAFDASAFFDTGPLKRALPDRCAAPLCP